MLACHHFKPSDGSAMLAGCSAGWFDGYVTLAGCDPLADSMAIKRWLAGSDPLAVIRWLANPLAQSMIALRQL